VTAASKQARLFEKRSKNFCLNSKSFLVLFFKKELLLAASFPFLPSTATARVFYIAATGTDTNAGTSKSAPWLHAPGMVNCTATCAATTPAPGDSVILRGGDFWHYGASKSTVLTGGEWDWHWSGTAASPIYIGVDPTWYAGASWTRPVLTGDGTYGDTGSFLNMGGSTYFTVDNLEFTGLYWDAADTVWGNATYIVVHESTDYLIEHNYFHGWSHASLASGTGDNGGGIIGSTYGNYSGGVAYANVFDGSDTAQDSFTTIYGAPESIYANVFNYVMSEQGTMLTFHDNLVMNIVNSFTDVPNNPNDAHPDAWQDNGSCNATFYNNVFHNTATGAQISMGPVSGCTDYAFNNVIYNMATTNGFAQGPGAVQNSGGLSVLFNNSIEGGTWTRKKPYGACFRIESSLATATIENTQCITSDSSIYFTDGASPLLRANQKLSLHAASLQGYSTGETYAFAPPSTTGKTVGHGANQQTSCKDIAVIDAAAGLACQSDTTYAVGYDTATHSVIIPGRIIVPRPLTGKWDVGAYQFP
jgi:hypothetical protein